MEKSIKEVNGFLLYLNRRFSKIINIICIIICLVVPLLLFLNRFLIPDVSFDSLNYHLFLGFKAFHWENSKFEFFPTGIHNYSSLFDIPSYILFVVLGYRTGTIGSLIFLYASIFVAFKIFRLFQPKYSMSKNWWWGVFFGSIFFSFNAFSQIATYFVDIEVTFFMLLCIYYLLKYERTLHNKNLFLFLIILSVLIVGKMTTWYMIIPCIIYLAYIVISNKRICLFKNIKYSIIFGIVFFIFLSLFFWQNLVATGNPIFPYFNQVFKSKYYPIINFEDLRWGGRNLFEKIFWGIFSIKQPSRLGEIEPLFHDYKINIYFFSSIIILIYSLIRKKKQLMQFTSLYLGIYICWSLMFGYLRYAISLEFLGGLLVLIWLAEFENITKPLIIVLMLILIGKSNKSIINRSLIYELSFRQGYSYKPKEYLMELKNINNNTIRLSNADVYNTKPDIYLNCVIPSMSFYVLSPFKSLPVLNIDKLTNKSLTNNIFYKKESLNRLNGLYKHPLSFVTIVVKKWDFSSQYNNCLMLLRGEGFVITKTIDINNLLGYNETKLTLIYGTIPR